MSSDVHVTKQPFLVRALGQGLLIFLLNVEGRYEVLGETF